LTITGESGQLPDKNDDVPDTNFFDTVATVGSIFTAFLMLFIGFKSLRYKKAKNKI